MQYSSGYTSSGPSTRLGHAPPKSTLNTWDEVQFTPAVQHFTSTHTVTQGFWRVETYELADIAALMQCVSDDSDASSVALRSEQPVAHIQYETDTWLNQRLSASDSEYTEDGHLTGSLSVRNAAGRLFDEPDAVHVRGALAQRVQRVMCFAGVHCALVRRRAPHVNQTAAQSTLKGLVVCCCKS